MVVLQIYLSKNVKGRHSYKIRYSDNFNVQGLLWDCSFKFCKIQVFFSLDSWLSFITFPTHMVLSTGHWQCCHVRPSLHCHLSPKPRPFWYLPRPHTINIHFIRSLKPFITKLVHKNIMLLENSTITITTCPWMLVFDRYFLNGHITAVYSAKNLSRPLWRPQIFTAIQLLKTATFEESGRDGGHLATLVIEHILCQKSRKPVFKLN
jgi:hypothetical protein